MRPKDLWVYVGIIICIGLIYGFQLKFNMITSIIYGIYSVGIGTILLLLINSEGKAFAYKYRTIPGVVRFLPTPYFVEKTYLDDWREVEVAFSISTFCSAKGSTANKVLLNLTFFCAGFLMYFYYRFGFEGFGFWKSMGYLIGPAGILMIGNAESSSHRWAPFHIVGIILYVLGVGIVFIEQELSRVILGVFVGGIILFGVGNVFVQKKYSKKIGSKKIRLLGLGMILYEFIIFSLPIIYLSIR